MLSRENISFILMGSLSSMTLFALYLSFTRRSSKSLGVSSVRNLSQKAWKVGTPQPIPFQSKTYKSYDAADLKSSGGMYSLLISTVVPRPIALVTSMNKEGVLNCAPFSFFNIVSYDPPLVMLGVVNNVRAKTKKDTLTNIEETGEFVINTISSWYLESANHTSGPFAPEINEMELAGLESVPSDIVSPPRLASSAVQFECKIHQIIPVLNDAQEHTTSMVIGRIQKVHIHEEVLTDKSKDTLKPIVDYAKLLPVGRLGGEMYTVVNNDIDLPRPSGKV